MRRAVFVWVVMILPAAPAVAAERGAAAPTTKPAPDLPAVAQRVVQLTNEFRKAEKLGPLRPNASLEKAAQYFAGHLAETGKFSHTADGKQPSERAAAAGYDYCIVAENLGFRGDSRGFTTEDLAAKLVASWKRSPEHRKNMLDPDVTETGVVVARSQRNGRYYAVQMFGRPKSARIQFTIANHTGEAVRYRVGDKEFSLPPRYVGTHSVCRPEELALAGSPPETAPSETVPAGGRRADTVRVQNNARYTIQAAGGKVAISPEQ